MDSAPACVGRYQTLDHWRGLACLMVVIDHAAIPLISSHEVYQAGGTLEWGLRWLAVASTRMALGPPIFFVISGYCIAASLESVRRKGKPPVQFITRRLWRTFPPYWIALGIMALVLMGLDGFSLRSLHDGPGAEPLLSPAELTRAQWFGTLSLSETWRCTLVGGTSHLFLGAAWTLCYLEQFYAVAFLCLALQPRHFHRALAAATILILFLRVVVWDAGMLDRLNGFFPMYWAEFAVGLSVYWYLNLVRDRRSLALGILLALLALLVVASLGSAGSTAIAAAFGLLLIGLHRFDAALVNTRALDGLRACGRRCYSIYLIHLPVVAILGRLLFERGFQDFWIRTLISLPLLAGLALAAAWLFYRHVECGFLELPRLKAPSRPRIRPTLGPLLTRAGWGSEHGEQPRRLVPAPVRTSVGP